MGTFSRGFRERIKIRCSSALPTVSVCPALYTTHWTVGRIGGRGETKNSKISPTGMGALGWEDSAANPRNCRRLAPWTCAGRWGRQAMPAIWGCTVAALKGGTNYCSSNRQRWSRGSASTWLSLLHIMKTTFLFCIQNHTWIIRPKSACRQIIFVIKYLKL